MRTYDVSAPNMHFHARIFVAGAVCALATNAQAVVDSISRIHLSTGKPTSRSFELNVLVDSSPGTGRKTSPYFRGLHHMVFAVFGDGEAFAFDLRRNVVFGVVSRETADDCHFWNKLLLPIAIGVLGTTVGVVPLHSACLDRDGKALLVAGPSGSGKSTLAVALSRHGFSLVSDDWTYITREGSRLTAYGLGLPVKLLPDAIDFFPELGKFRPAQSLNGELAYEVHPSEVFSSEVRFQSEPSRLLFLERAQGANCDFLPLSGDEAKRFFEASAERLPGEFAAAAADRSETIARLTQCDCWLVRTGLPPNETAEAISHFCEGM